MEETLQSREPGLPLTALEVEVLEGPDAGKRFAAKRERVAVGTAPGNDLVLTDPTVSRYHVELIREEDRIRVIDHGSTNGTVVSSIHVERGSIPAGSVLVLGKSRVAVRDGSPLRLELHEGESLGGLRGRSPAMRLLMARIAKVAKSDTPVLVLGESGTGKELVARALHDLSPRAKKPFVTVDCGALSPTLASSELFGHERGSFSGAERRHVGAFERANGGTILLDEIGELTPALQASLLGALERRRFLRVGGSEEISVDVRVVAATHRDLRVEVNRGTFRLDLFYRLAVVTLEVPPLRDRREDIALLVDHFSKEAGATEPLKPEALDALRAHSWPGNVRELRNVVEAALALGEAPRVAPAGGSPTVDVAMPFKEARRLAIDAFEKAYLETLLARTKGNAAAAAREAGIDRSYLFDLIKKHEIR